MPDAPVDWQDMFRRYVGVVEEHESVTFLYSEDWSESEWAAIYAAVPLQGGDRPK